MIEMRFLFCFFLCCYDMVNSCSSYKRVYYINLHLSIFNLFIYSKTKLVCEKNLDVLSSKGACMVYLAVGWPVSFTQQK